MWTYKKILQYPANIRRKDPEFASLVITQFGGPDGELSAGVRYLSQMYTMPFPEGKAILNSIGTEELAHWEIIGTLVYKLVKDVPPQVLREAGFGAHYAQHGRANYPSDAAGVPWTAAFIQSHEDPVASLHEDLAAEEKARATYEYLIDMTNDPAIIDTLSFLRMREVVHFQRFGEALDLLYDYMEDHHDEYEF
ncbi:manganese catalase family protein [Halothermothrix orenii]|uniref:Manganese containing catalase n=1 Tax=Halothermothrix orenii (strain H 168 / OCM 544 / DSM 9562) TaxID=373903 RepID=B8D198_HALOH|nr:manganese catalase family protein [Halothermothrix orenii]ACL71050.1 manganese containing catalase [Halothermothrix orenii H 168]